MGEKCKVRKKLSNNSLEGGSCLGLVWAASLGGTKVSIPNWKSYLRVTLEASEKA